MFSFIKKYVGFFLLFGGIIGIGAINLAKNGAGEDASLSTNITTLNFTTTSRQHSVDELVQTISTTSHEVYVDIKGAVVSPGVYVLETGTRIFQALQLAGGTLGSADTSCINLAQEIFDEMIIYIPEVLSTTIQTTDNISTICVQIRGEVKSPKVYYIPEASTLADLINVAGGLTDEADISHLNFSMTLCSGFSIEIPIYKETTMPEDETNSGLPDIDDGLIDINSADLEELMLLKGIGMVLGQRIIDYRAEYGGFSSIEDIMFVSGIKESIYENIKDDIKVGDW